MIKRFKAYLRCHACTAALFAGMCAAVASPASARAANSGVKFDPPAQLVLGLGMFNIADRSGSPIPDNNHSSLLLRGEYRSGKRLFSGKTENWRWGVGPQIGGLVNGDSGAMVYAGLFGDFVHHGGFFISPAFNAGLYKRGDGRDLGGTVEFEEALTLGWVLRNDHRVGVTFSHISNADLYDRNPGVETVMLNYSMPLGGRTQAPMPVMRAPKAPDSP